MSDDLPVAVIGGGPVGLAAAAHLLARNIPVRLYEAGETIAAARRLLNVSQAPVTHYGSD